MAERGSATQWLKPDDEYKSCDRATTRHRLMPATKFGTNVAPVALILTCCLFLVLLRHRFQRCNSYCVSTLMQDPFDTNRWIYEVPPRPRGMSHLVLRWEHY